MSIPELVGEKRVLAKIRYAHKGELAIIKMLDDDLVEVVFDNPVRAVTKGQAVVFYEEDYIVGGGTII
jgi:tRNA-specific 2-thiouridylase